MIQRPRFVTLFGKAALWDALLRLSHETRFAQGNSRRSYVSTSMTVSTSGSTNSRPNCSRAEPTVQRSERGDPGTAPPDSLEASPRPLSNTRTPRNSAERRYPVQPVSSS